VFAKSTACQVAIIGAGPFGLSAAAHLRAAGAEVRIFGEPMGFWERHMPIGMLLRSSPGACHISDPHRTLTLTRYQASSGLQPSVPVPLDRFIEYGRWFQIQVAPDLDRRRVERLERSLKGLRLVLEDGESFQAQRVVVAAGIAPFARCPPQFDALPSALASHSLEHRDLRRFAGRRLVVVGGGQSALESAALLHEAGADVEVITRASRIHWLDQYCRWLKSRANPLRPLLYPPTDVGPPGLNWIVALPVLFRQFPGALQRRIAYRSIRPAGAGWLLPRFGGVQVTTGCSIRAATPIGSQLRLSLDDGSERRVDHALLATGYRVDLSRYSFLAPDLVHSLCLIDGYPRLSAGFESSLPGLHFLGAPAAQTFGPLCRFVVGTGYTSHALTRHIIGRARHFTQRERPPVGLSTPGPVGQPVSN
jgi:FAD-dependent urate hydroxylase